MKLICSTFVLLLLIGSCASVPYNPSKPEMSVPEDSSYKLPPRAFRSNLDY